MRKPVIGVMGASASEGLSAEERTRFSGLGSALAAALAKRNCILLTGATTGLPGLVATEFRKGGGFALGVSPAINRDEHLGRYGLPDDGADVIVYTGFGLKGRNVINIRSSDVVVIFGGGTGTLNEFTIAYDEGKIIGVLEGTGGIADHIKELLKICKKSTSAEVLYSSDPDNLLEQCLERYNLRGCD